MPPGSLVIVGTGITMAAHVTVEAKAWIQQADQVFFLVPGPIAAEWICQINPKAIDLSFCYGQGKRRIKTYREMVTHILAAVRKGQRVCAVFYGHPGIFVVPAHQAIRQARQEGFEAWMLPGISTEDCLFADLGIDPAWHGCQSFEATDFLVRPRRFDTTTGLLLWQVGVIGNLGPPQKEKAPGLAILAEVLAAHYGQDYEIIIYEAAQHPGFDPLIQHIPLSQMSEARITSLSTVYVPPKESAALDTTMWKRLGLPTEEP
jgi:uncharacterized protein YabN with tetrapyrrole methylase and pyrophosphatase domain